MLGAVVGEFLQMSIHSFHARGDHHRSTNTWQMLLAAATTEQEVVQITRDFIASFTPHEIELMPRECRPLKIVDGEDIAQYSYDLAVHRCDEADEGAAVIHAFVHFFGDASEHIARVKHGDDSGQREIA